MKPIQEVLFQTSLAHITQCSYIGGNFPRINQLYGDFLMSLNVLRFFLLAEFTQQDLAVIHRYMSRNPWRATSSRILQLPQHSHPSCLSTPRMGQHLSHKHFSTRCCSESGSMTTSETFFDSQPILIPCCQACRNKIAGEERDVQRSQTDRRDRQRHEMYKWTSCSPIERRQKFQNTATEEEHAIMERSAPGWDST